MSNYEEIKNLLKASRTLLGGQKLNEDIDQIRKSHGLLTEQEVENPTEKVDTMKDIEDTIEYETADSDENEDKKSNSNEKSKAYRISGGIIVLHGDDKTEVQLTTDDKVAFQESMDEFVSEVSEIVDFNKLNVYENNVEWSGKIAEMDVDFFFSIGETNGVYINGDMLKLDDEFLDLVNKLQSYYQKFKSKWSKVIASRKKTPEK